MAALMPPAAATECERTGWTLLRIATDAPSSAAAWAARWPARPAPMMRTSCAGMGYLNSSTGPRRGGLRLAALHEATWRGRAEGAADLLDGDHAAQALVGVDDHERPQRPQPLHPEEVLDRGVVEHAHVAVGARVEDLAHLERGAPVGDGPL